MDARSCARPIGRPDRDHRVPRQDLRVRRAGHRLLRTLRRPKREGLPGLHRRDPLRTAYCDRGRLAQGAQSRGGAISGTRGERRPLGGRGARQQLPRDGASRCSSRPPQLPLASVRRPASSPSRRRRAACSEASGFTAGVEPRHATSLRRGTRGFRRPARLKLWPPVPLALLFCQARKKPLCRGFQDGP